MKRHAFTIVELLVVISTIALLTAILLPALQNTKQKARTILCSSNIKQLTIAMITYDSTHQTFPYGYYQTTNLSNTDCLGFLQYDKLGLWWLNYIMNISRKDYKKSIAWCPSRRIDLDMLKYNVLCNNYGVNQSICKSSTNSIKYKLDFVGAPLSSNEIPKPGKTFLLADSGYAIIKWWQATNSPPSQLGSTMEESAYIPGLKINKDRKLWSGQEEDAIYGRHPQKTVNVGFVDGHISTIKADEFLIEKSGDTYNNLTPLWKPY
jgi:prepilin-type processing-associated H-X9-DG protein